MCDEEALRDVRRAVRDEHGKAYKHEHHRGRHGREAEDVPAERADIARVTAKRVFHC